MADLVLVVILFLKNLIPKKPTPGVDLRLALFQFPPPPFHFFSNSLHESLFKIIFNVINCNKTCQREQLNKFSLHF